ncbi:MAG TPA: hypothetical protein VKB90_02530 [Candidatus Acidoferrum sp.]|nr:hypothetical protein [Candidatus Acidoferrum sp.]
MLDHTDNPKVGSSRLRSVLTDVHFWVPVAILAAGLLLLSFLR